MKTIVLLPVSLALLLAGCATYDPDFQREYSQVQNVDYPPNKIVGRWLQVGYDPPDHSGMSTEHRVFDFFFADGTGLHQSVCAVPDIYQQYRDLFAGTPDFTGELIVECTTTWKYLGKNKWEVRNNPDFKIVSRPTWIISTNPKVGPPGIVRYYADKLFYADSRSTAVLVTSDADAAAKIARMRAAAYPRMHTYLQNRRAQQNLVRGMYGQPQAVVGPGYSAPPSPGRTLYY